MAIAQQVDFYNGQAIALDELPQVEVDELREIIADAVSKSSRLVALFGQPVAAQRVRLYAVLADHEQGALTAWTCDVGDRYPAITPLCPAAHWFEREIAEQWGVVPLGHPWLKPIRFHASYRPGHDAWGRLADSIEPSVTDFFRMQGIEAHQVAVGPVHAGVIEPGHFRFQCHGEVVYHLEVSLGYQHRGVERALIGGPNKRTIHYMETLAGDTTIGHSLAYALAMEGLSGCAAPPQAEMARGLALELERLANHTGDLGGLSDDVGFLPTAAYCGRLRGDFLNATGLICGSRFGRGLVRPGGVGFDIDEDLAHTLSQRLTAALADVKQAGDLLWNTPSVQARFEGVGAVAREDCEALGMVGVVARACGIEQDVRHDFPAGMFRFAQLPVASANTGDVFARAYVRGLEINRSGAFVLDTLKAMGRGPIRAPMSPLRPSAMAVSLVEGWRGRICHVAITDAERRFARYKVVDPSFHNWIGLALALRGQQISDFPLCNKSFSLSYCGHDL